MSQQATSNQRASDSVRVEPLRWLRSVAETVAHDFAPALAMLLRCAVEVAPAGVDRVAYGRFVGGVQTPAYFNVITPEPLDDRLLLDIEPSILYAMIDRLLGGSGADQPPPGRPLTDVELPLAARVVRMFLDQLAAAWGNGVAMKFDPSRAESNPRLARVLPSDEIVAVAAFQLQIGESQGTLRLGVPWRTLEQIGRRPPSASENGANAKVGSVELEAVLATTRIAAAELAGLRPGDIIVTETAAGSPTVASLSGEPKLFAQPGTCQGHKAIQVAGTTDK